MKKLILLPLIVLLSGCISPLTKQTTWYNKDTGIKVKEVIEQKSQSYIIKSLGFGLKIGIDENKIPIVWFGIVKSEKMVASDNHTAKLKDDYKDISLVTGSGSANTIMEIKLKH